MTIDEAEKIKTAVENNDYIVQLVNAVTKTMIEAFENLKIEDVNMFQLVYNNAIDDFAKLIKQRKFDYIKKCVEFDSFVDEIAEQLKVGEENE